MQNLILIAQFMGILIGVFALIWLFMPPIVKTERLLPTINASNTFFKISMNRSYVGPFVSGTFAQELHELKLKRKHPIKRYRWESKNPKTKMKSLEFMQELEICGHAVDIIEAVEIGGDLQERIADEMFVLPFYEQFIGVPEDEIERRLVAALPAARDWHKKNVKAIKKQRFRNRA